MQSKNSYPVDAKKKVLVSVLFVVALAICASGIFYSVYSLTYHISFQVLNTQVPGVVFGVAVFYLGIRYFLSLMNLRKEVYKPTSRFSWANFKKDSSKKSK